MSALSFIDRGRSLDNTGKMAHWDETAGLFFFALHHWDI